MSEVYEFEMDADGNGTDDYVVAEQYDDGSIVTVADLDGDGIVDVATYDADGDGVAEDTWETPGGYSSGGAPIAEGEPTSSEAYAGSSESPSYTSEGSSDQVYADPAVVSEMLATQHETNMAIINNMA